MKTLLFVLGVLGTALSLALIANHLATWEVWFALPCLIAMPFFACWLYLHGR